MKRFFLMTALSMSYQLVATDWTQEPKEVNPDEAPLPFTNPPPSTPLEQEPLQEKSIPLNSLQERQIRYRHLQERNIPSNSLQEQGIRSRPLQEEQIPTNSLHEEPLEEKPLQENRIN